MDRPRITAPQTAAPVPEEDEGEFDFRDLLTQLLARKWLIATAVVLGGIIGAFNGQLPPNEYRASSVVQIERRASGVSLPSAVIGDILGGNSASQGSLGTEIHIIRSRLILGPVTEELDLDDRVLPEKAPVIGEMLARRDIPLIGALIDGYLPASYQRAGEYLELGRLEVPEDLVGRRFTLEVTGADRFVVTTPDGARVEGRVGERLTLDEAVQLEIAALSAAPGRVYTLVEEPLRSSVSRLRGGLSIRERGSTGIVDFSYTSGDPEASREIVNAVVASYQEQNLRRRSAEIDQSIAFIESQLPEIRAALGEASEALADYRQSQQEIELSLGTQEILDRIVELQGRIEELDYQEEQLSQTLTPSHPDYRALLAERERLEARLAELRQDLRAVPETEQELARLTERVESNRTLERQLIQRVEQLRIVKASTVGNIRVLEPAEVAGLVGPDRRGPARTGAILGLVAAVGLIFGLNFLRRGIEDARQIEELGLPLFGSVGKVESLVGKRSSDPDYALALRQPDNLSVEALRGLRTGLQFSLAATQAKSVMITSCAPGDGKSFIALNLAIVTAQTDRRVLLIDADMRRGELGKYFGFSRRDPGLSDYLSGRRAAAECVARDETAGIDFLGTGTFPPNPAELLAGPRWTDLLDAATEHYDLVLVDAPPALAVSDPGIIGQATGVTLLVIKHLATTQAELQSAQKTLANAGVQVSGVILNQYDQKRSRYGSYGSKYSYHYGGYRYKYKS